MALCSWDVSVAGDPLMVGCHLLPKVCNRTGGRFGTDSESRQLRRVAAVPALDELWLSILFIRSVHDLWLRRYLSPKPLIQSTMAWVSEMGFSERSIGGMSGN